jgi:hypothetical protein
MSREIGQVNVIVFIFLRRVKRQENKGTREKRQWTQILKGRDGATNEGVVPRMDSFKFFNL